MLILFYGKEVDNGVGNSRVSLGRPLNTPEFPDYTHPGKAFMRLSRLRDQIVSKSAQGLYFV